MITFSIREMEKKVKFHFTKECNKREICAIIELTYLNNEARHMKYYNCYFSPTGGTKKVADAVAAGWGAEFTPVDLLLNPPEIAWQSDDLCLMAVPSYGGRIPAPVAETISRMNGNGARAVLIAVFGNRAIDDTLLELSDVMKAAGFRCVAAMEAVAQHSLIRGYGAGRPDDADLGQLKSFAKQIHTAVENGTASEDVKVPGNRPYREYNGVPLKPATACACKQCGLCARECPVGAISLENCRVTDTKKCISCMHCVKI